MKVGIIGAGTMGQGIAKAFAVKSEVSDLTTLSPSCVILLRRPRRRCRILGILAEP